MNESFPVHVNLIKTLSFPGDENEILESVANRTLLSRSPKPPSTPRPDDDGMYLSEQEDSIISSPHSEPDPSRKQRHNHKRKQHELKPPSFGITPASPTSKVPPEVHEQVPQFFLSTSPSNWYERRTSSPQTPGEVMMATISPIRMVHPGQQRSSPHGSFVAIRSLSPTSSVPHIPFSGHLNIQQSPHPSVTGSISSFGSSEQQQHHYIQHPQNLGLSVTTGRKSPLLPRTPVPGELPQDVLVDEIKRLREKLQLLESENSAMTVKLSSVHSEFEGRLAEIESQMIHSSDTASKSMTGSKPVVTNEQPSQQVGTAAGSRETSSNNQSISGQKIEHQIGTSHILEQVARIQRSDVTSPISEVSNTLSDHTPSSSCGSEELSERNRESII